MKTRDKTQKTSTQLNPIRSSAKWLEEPLLQFADGLTHCDPRIGIPLYGPRSLGTSRHKSEVHLGFIGTGEAVASAQDFYSRCQAGVSGDENNAPFPGIQPDRGFRCALKFDSVMVEPITAQEKRTVLSIRNQRQRFEHFLSLAESKLKLLTEKDHPLDYVVFALPGDLYQQCRIAEYMEKGGKVHRDFRRAFKALAMRYHKPTQILLEPTTGAVVDDSEDLDHPARIAWNIFTGLYFKVDGLPWGPIGLQPATCFVGISFFRPLGEASTLRSSVIQAFDENGEGLVLRGHSFHWDESKGASPHLPADLASKLVEMVLERYHLERKQYPKRVVIHKTSFFDDEELRGFQDGLKKVDQFDLISMTPVSDIRLSREGVYPPLRGTCFELGNKMLLYTSGYLHTAAAYPHGHVPSPMLITKAVGDTSKAQLFREILILTKMNWNSANMAGLKPITIRFSQSVGEILREVSDPNPQTKFRYYM